MTSLTHDGRINAARTIRVASHEVIVDLAKFRQQTPYGPFQFVRGPQRMSKGRVRCIEFRVGLLRVADSRVHLNLDVLNTQIRTAELAPKLRFNTYDGCLGLEPTHPATRQKVFNISLLCLRRTQIADRRS